MGVGFQVPIKNLVSILISTAVKTARVASLSALKGLSFPLTGYSYEDLIIRRKLENTDLEDIAVCSVNISDVEECPG
jgi:hypothetical protein